MPSTRRRKGKGKGGGLKLKGKEKNKYTETQPASVSPQSTPPLPEPSSPGMQDPPPHSPVLPFVTPSRTHPLPIPTLSPSHDQSPNITVLYDYHQSFDAADLEAPVRSIEELAALFKDSPTGANPQPRCSFGFPLWRDAESPTLPASKKIKYSISPLTATREGEGMVKLHALASQLQQRMDRQHQQTSEGDTVLHFTDCKLKLQLDEEPPTISEPVLGSESKEEGSKTSSLLPPFLPPPPTPEEPAKPCDLVFGAGESKEDSKASSAQLPPLHPPPPAPSHKPFDPLDVLFGVCEDERGEGGGGGGGGGGGDEGGKLQLQQVVLNEELTQTRSSTAPAPSCSSTFVATKKPDTVNPALQSSCTAMGNQTDLQARVILPACDNRATSSTSTSGAGFTSNSCGHSQSSASGKLCKATDAVSSTKLSEELVSCDLDKGEEEEGGFWSQAAELVNGGWEDTGGEVVASSVKQNEFEDTMADVFIDQLLFDGIDMEATPSAKQVLIPSTQSGSSPVSTVSHHSHPSIRSNPLKDRYVPMSHACSSVSLSNTKGSLSNTRGSLSNTKGSLSNTKGSVAGAHNYVQHKRHEGSKQGPTGSSMYNQNRIRLIPGAIGPPCGQAPHVPGLKSAHFHKPLIVNADSAVGSAWREGGHSRCSQSEIERKREQAKLRLSQRLRQRRSNSTT